MKYPVNFFHVFVVGFLQCIVAQMHPSFWVYVDLKDLPMDENNHLLTHFLLHTNNQACIKPTAASWVGRNPYIRIGSTHENASIQLFGEDYNPDLCYAACPEKGMSVDHLKAGLIPPRMFYPIEGESEEDEAARMKAWFHKNCYAAEVGFISYLDNEAEVYWIHPNTGEKHLTGRLPRGEKYTLWSESYIGHEFDVVYKETQEVVKRVIVEHAGINVVGHGPSGISQRNNTLRIKDTLDLEWGRSRNVVRTFTELGFAHGKLPVDLYGSIATYYYNCRSNKSIEEWEVKGVHINFWEADVFLTPMPWGLKKYWQERLRVLVEGWSGVALELTDIYGIREYTDGSRLLTHTDREETHAASLIINVNQYNMREPWYIEIYDFADRLHEIEMQPGDIVYYESARCLHGRMKPLRGDAYVNLFAHYRPAGGDRLWYTRENPPNSPSHLLDIGECTGNEKSRKVECTSGINIPSLSPSLEKLIGPLDLFKYWEKVSPAPGENFGQGRLQDDTFVDLDSTVSTIHSEL